MGDVYTLLCLRSAELSKPFGLRNLCDSKIFIMMLLEYMEFCENSSQNEENMPCAQTLHI